MEAPPPSPPPFSTGPESIDSSPRSRHTDSWDTDLPPPPPQKLRLMCSYGGHIVPRPHDKTLCYIGGDTRIIVVDRHTSLSDLHHRLSKTLLQNQSFSLKYQLPNEDLDSLISVTTDEDLDNMVEEYDRLYTSTAGKPPGRLRLFLFPTATENIEQLLVETASTKSDDWFFNALNGKTSNLSDRGFSESSSVNCLLGLDDDSVGKAAAASASAAAPDSQIEGSKGGTGGNNIATVNNHDVHSVPDSPMLETTSSFGSTSSSPSVANLPPIRVKVEENLKTGTGLGIEEQFQQMAVGIAGNINYAVAPSSQEVGPVVSGVPVVVGGEYAANRVVSDDERSDHSGYRKVQHVQHQVQPPQQIPQFQIKQTGAVELPSPDSVSSEGSITNHLTRQRHHGVYQESILQMQSGNLRNTSDPQPIDQNNTKIQLQQESGFMLPPQFDQIHQQPQFIHAGNQFIPAGAMPVTSYYPIYPHQQPLDQQYPFYFMPARPTQAYNYAEMAPTGSTRPQTPPPPMTGYNQAINAPNSKPEMASGVYRTGNPQLVQIPSSHQHQPQYVGYTHVHHPSQSMAPSSAVNPNYEFADPAHAQMYYMQQQPLPPQYQTVTTAPAGFLPDGSAQLPTDNMKQQVRNLQQ